HFKGLGPHLGDKLLRIVVVEQLILTREFINDIEVFFFREEIKSVDTVLFLNTRLNYDIAFIVNNLIQLLGRKSDQISNLIRQRAEIPDMRYGHHQFDVSHTLTPHLLLGNLYATAVADDTLIANTLILSTMTFPVLHRAEDPFAE